MVLTTSWQTIATKRIGNSGGDVNVLLQAKYSYQDIAHNRTYGVQYRAVAEYTGSGSITDALSNASCGGDGVATVTGTKADVYEGGAQYVLCTTTTGVIVHDAGGYAHVACSATLSFPSYGWSGTASTEAQLPTISQAEHNISVQIQSITAQRISFRATADTTCDTWQYSLDNGAWTTFSYNSSTVAETSIPVASGNHTLKVRALESIDHVYIVSDTYTFNNVAPTVAIAMVSKTRNTITVNATADVRCTAWTFYIDGVAQTPIVNEGRSQSFTYTGLRTYSTHSLRVVAQNASGTLTGSSSAILIRTKGGGGRLQINGTWKEIVPYVKVNGAWKESVAYTKVGNTWKENA